MSAWVIVWLAVQFSDAPGASDEPLAGVHDRPLAFGSVTVGVAVVGALRGPKRFPWWSLLVAAAIPAALLVPWALFNLDHYDALTPAQAARRQQEIGRASCRERV